VGGAEGGLGKKSSNRVQSGLTIRAIRRTAVCTRMCVRSRSAQPLGSSAELRHCAKRP
jgi:hypothetical protein